MVNKLRTLGSSAPGRGSVRTPFRPPAHISNTAHRARLTRGGQKKRLIASSRGPTGEGNRCGSRGGWHGDASRSDLKAWNRPRWGSHGSLEVQAGRRAAIQHPRPIDFAQSVLPLFATHATRRSLAFAFRQHSLPTHGSPPCGAGWGGRAPGMPADPTSCAPFIVNPFIRFKLSPHAPELRTGGAHPFETVHRIGISPCCGPRDVMPICSEAPSQQHSIRRMSRMRDTRCGAPQRQTARSHRGWRNPSQIGGAGFRIERLSSRLAGEDERHA